MTKQQYLNSQSVKEFVKWIRPKLSAKNSFIHGYTDAKSKVIYNFDLKKPEYSFETIKSSAIGINHALKITNKGFYSLNDYGLHYYNR